MVANAAIRLGMEGKQEVKSGLAEVGKEGKDAFTGIAHSSDQAGAAIDRQEAKWLKIASAARDAGKAAEQQARFNAVLGVGPSGAGPARESAEVFEAAARAVEQQQAKVIALRAALDPLSVAQERHNGELREYRTLAAAGAISTQELAAAEALSKKRLDETTMAIQRQSGARRGLTQVQKQTLVYTASDVLASGASGMSPAMIAMQQGPQVLQAFVTGGAAASAAMVGLGVALGTVAVATGAAVAAGLSHHDALLKLDAAANGTAARLGLTGEQLDNLAQRSARSGDVTMKAARDMTLAYADGGKIAAPVIETLIGLTNRYAVATGQDAKGATEQLARTFGDLGKNVGEVNGKLGFLDDTTARHVRTLLEQNRTTEAQIVVARALEDRLGATATKVTTLGGAWDVVGRKAAAAWEAMGRGMDRLIFGGTKAQQLAELLRERSDLIVYDDVTKRMASALDGRIATARRELAAERAETARTQAEARTATQGQQARDAIDRAAPIQAELSRKRAELATIEAAIKSGATKNTAQAQTAVKNLKSDIGAMEKGYSNAAAQASALGRAQRGAAKDARDAAREAREAEREAEERTRNRTRLEDLDLQHRLTIARTLGDTDSHGRINFVARANIQALEQEQDIRQRIAAFQSAGLQYDEARLRAERDIGRELLAQYQARIRAPANGDFDAAAAQRAGWERNLVLFDENTDALTRMGVVGEGVFDRFAAGLAQGELSWKSWKDVARSSLQDVLGEMLRLTAINPLKNFLFSGMSGYSAAPTAGGGFLSSLWKGLSNIGRNAEGTDNWRGGPTWVGEKGPEIVDLPRGARVIPNDRVAAMGGSSVVVNVNINAQGAGPREVDALRSEMAGFKRDLPAMIVQATNDGMRRRMIGG